MIRCWVDWRGRLRAEHRSWLAQTLDCRRGHGAADADVAGMAGFHGRLRCRFTSDTEAE